MRNVGEALLIIYGKQMIDTVITKNPDSGVQCLLVSLRSVTCSCGTLGDLRLRLSNLCNTYPLPPGAGTPGTVGVSVQSMGPQSVGGGGVQGLVTLQGTILLWGRGPPARLLEPSEALGMWLSGFAIQPLPLREECSG